MADIKKDDLRKTERIVITTRKGKEITKIVFPNRLQVGITDTDFHPGAQIFGSVGVSGSLTVSGSSTFTVHGPSIFNGDIKSSGFVTSSMGFSGSLTRLVDGESYLVAGANVTITSESNGQVTITAAGGSGSPGGSSAQFQYNGGGSFAGSADLTYNGTDGDITVGTATGDSKLFFRDSGIYINSPADGTLNIIADTKLLIGANSQVLVLSGGAPVSPNEANGTDTVFFVSGSTGSKDTSVKGTSLFGGDLVVSGNLYTSEYIYHEADTDTYIQFSDDEIQIAAGGRTFIKLEEASTDKMTINHGALDIDLQVKGENEANLIRTDAANDRVGIGTSSPTHVLSVVGAVSASLGLSGSLTRLVNGTSYLAAGANVTITSASNGQVTIAASSGGGGGGGSGDYQSKSSDFSAGTSEYMFGINTTSGAVTATLPACASAGAGKQYIFKDVAGQADSNNISIATNGSETVDGAGSANIMVASGSMTLMTDGSNWFVIGVS